MENLSEIQPSELTNLQEISTNPEQTNWWKKLTSNLLERIDAPTRAFLLTVIMEMAMSTHAEAQAQPNQTQAPPNKSVSTLTVEASVDSQEMYEAWLRFKSKNGWLFVNQNHTESNTKVDFVYGGFGKEVALDKKTKLSATTGPQFDLNRQKISHIAGFTNINTQIGNIKINSINRFAVPIEDRYAFVDKHVQNISGIPKVPSGVSIQAEERHTAGKADRWDELKIGTAIEFSIPGGKGKAYAYADAATKSLGFRFIFNSKIK